MGPIIDELETSLVRLEDWNFKKEAGCLMIVFLSDAHSLVENKIF